MIDSSYQVEATTWIKSYLHLGPYPDKVFSAGGTVWSIPWSSTVPITVVGGRDLGYFRVSRSGIFSSFLVYMYAGTRAFS